MIDNLSCTIFSHISLIIILGTGHEFLPPESDRHSDDYRVGSG